MYEADLMLFLVCFFPYFRELSYQAKKNLTLRRLRQLNDQYLHNFHLHTNWMLFLNIYLLDSKKYLQWECLEFEFHSNIRLKLLKELKLNNLILFSKKHVKDLFWINLYIYIFDHIYLFLLFQLQSAGVYYLKN